jgi:hypothetical protein
VNRYIAQTLAVLFGDLASEAAFRELAETALAATRGFAMFIPIGPPGLDERWQATRRQLLALYDRSMAGG